MQFQSIVAALSLALVASAAPNSPAPVNQCGQGQVTACCDSLLNSIGIACIVTEIVDLVDNTCPQSQALACCNSDAQTGLINIGTVCVPLSLNL